MSYLDVISFFKCFALFVVPCFYAWTVIKNWNLFTKTWKKFVAPLLPTFICYLVCSLLSFFGELLYYLK